MLTHLTVRHPSDPVMCSLVGYTGRSAAATSSLQWTQGHRAASLNDNDVNSKKPSNSPRRQNTTLSMCAPLRTHGATQQRRIHSLWRSLIAQLGRAHRRRRRRCHISWPIDWCAHFVACLRLSECVCVCARTRDHSCNLINVFTARQCHRQHLLRRKPTRIASRCRAR